MRGTATLLWASLCVLGCRSVEGTPVPGAAGRGPGALTVRVLDPRGWPAPGTEVWLLNGVGEADAAVDARIAAAMTGDLVETMRRLGGPVAQADGQGEVRLALHGVGGPAMVVASGARGFAQLELPAPTPGASVELALAPVSVAQVRAVTTEDEPVVGLPVSLALMSLAGTLEVLPITAVTDESGLATLRWPRESVPVVGEDLRVVVARAALEERCWVEWPGARPDESATMTLPPLRRIRLRAPRIEGVEDHLTGVVTAFPTAHGSRSDATLAALLDGEVVDLCHAGPDTPLSATAILALPDRPWSEALLGRVEWTVPAAELAAGELTVPLDEHTLVSARIPGASVGDVVEITVPGRPRSRWESRVGGDGVIRWLARGRGPLHLRIVAGEREAILEVDLPGGGKAIDLGALDL